MRAVLYCRVSTVEQASNLSLSTQEEACRAYCVKHGYDVAAVFIDAGESAKTVNRTEFRRMLVHCRTKANGVRAVIVYSLTRFSRNSADHHAIVGLLRGLGITLRSVTEPIDESPSGKLMEGILASMAQFDNDVRAERTVAGMKAAVARGRWVWTPPLGYKTGVRRGSPSLVLDPDRAPILREAFERVAAGTLTGRPLRAWLTGQGLRGRAGKPLTLGRLYAILRHPMYAGRIESASGDAPGDYEALITPAVFQAVQRRLDVTSGPIKFAVRHVHHPDFPLRRFVTCHACGKGLTGSWSTGRAKRRYAFYRCLAGCTKAKRAALHDAFLALTDALTPTPGCLRLVRETVLESWTRERNTGREGAGRAQRELARLEQRLEHVDRLFIDGRIDDDTYRTQRNALREQIALARIALHESEEVEIDIEGMLAFAVHALANMSALWSDAPTPLTRARIQEIFFPDGLSWNPKTRTFLEPTNLLAIFNLQAPRGPRSRLMTPTGTGWNQITAWLQHFQQLKAA